LGSQVHRDSNLWFLFQSRLHGFHDYDVDDVQSLMPIERRVSLDVIAHEGAFPKGVKNKPR
jgi:hypothetical protein